MNREQQITLRFTIARIVIHAGFAGAAAYVVIHAALQVLHLITTHMGAIQ